MRNWNWIARASVLAMAMPLAACGGGGSGGVASTPTPTPTPVTYTKIVDMSGNRTFKTGGVTFSPTSTGLTGGSVQNFASGSTVQYDAASDTYTLTSPSGETATFNPSGAQSVTTPNVQQWQTPIGTGREILTLLVPSANGVPLSYTIFGTWQSVNTSSAGNTVRLAVGGAPTVASDMPRSGTASYASAIYGTAISSNVPYNLNEASKVTFSADYGAGTVTTSLNLSGKTSASAPAVAFGTYSGNGTITSGGPGFTGTLTGTNSSGAYSGAFFGPAAAEMGYAFYLSGSTFSAAGSVAGIKQ